MSTLEQGIHPSPRLQSDMPVENKPLPPIQNQATDFLCPPNLDFIAQVHEATSSPSTITRLLQDPTILPLGSAEDLDKERKHRSRSRSRQKEHRSPFIAAIAIAEEEKRAKQLKALLRDSSERLEYEMRRAEEATARADFAERQEKEAFARAKTAQAAKFEMENEAMRVERELRNHQIELEGSQRETARLKEEIHDMKREMEELQNAENRAQRSLREFQLAWKKMEIRTSQYAIEVQAIVDKSYKDGKEDGYNEGYEDGCRAGVKEGVKKGRKEGLREGREQGRIEERRNALEAFDRFLSEDTNDTQRSPRIRRWAQSVYRAGDGDSETLGPQDSGSVIKS